MLINNSYKEIELSDLKKYPKRIHKTVIDSFKRGFSAEERFKELAKKKGFKVLIPNKDMDKYQHIDLILIEPNKELEFTVDVKAVKRISMKDGKFQDKYLWIELINNWGYKGWVFRNMDFIAFEMLEPKGFLIVPTYLLRQFVVSILKKKEEKYGKIKITNNPYEALYGYYRRPNTKCLCTLIKKEHLEKFLKTHNKLIFWKEE